MTTGTRFSCAWLAARKLEGDMRMARKTDYERLVEQFGGKGGPPTPEEAARLFEERGNTQPAPGFDNDGNPTGIFKSKADVPDDFFDFEIIGQDDDPADISEGGK